MTLFYMNFGENPSNFPPNGLVPEYLCHILQFIQKLSRLQLLV
jgi:hypothetical protein